MLSVRGKGTPQTNEAALENPADAAAATAPTKAPADAPRPVLVPRIHTFARVPTHVVGVPEERRNHPRAGLHLPLRLIKVAGEAEPAPVSLLTKNISSNGVFFLAPRHIEPGTPIELEVALVDRPLGQGSVRMSTAAHVVRVEEAHPAGWHGLACTFDDIAFDRDEHVPDRYRR